MDKLKTAYFAGLIDGEGNISMKSNGQNRNKRPNIRVNMTCQKTIEALYAHFGVGSIGYRKPPKNSKHWKPQWIWEASFKSAIFVLDEILPFLITKKANAEYVCSFRLIEKS